MGKIRNSMNGHTHRPHKKSEKFPPTINPVADWYYIYCYTNTITIQESIKRCPPYVFKLPISTQFETAGRKFAMSVKKITMKKNEERAIDVVYEAHFNITTDNYDESIILDSLNTAKKELETITSYNEKSIRIERNSWVYYAIITIPFILFGITTLLFYRGIIKCNCTTDKKDEVSFMQLENPRTFRIQPSYAPPPPPMDGLKPN